jgi:hypothetical protein
MFGRGSAQRLKGVLRGAPPQTRPRVPLRDYRAGRAARASAVSVSDAHWLSRLAKPAHRAVNESDCRKALVARAMDAAASAPTSLGSAGIDNMSADSVVNARI